MPEETTDTTCPSCGATMMAIVYGMPSYELFQAAERGEVILGGCLVSEDNPTVHCPDCD